MKLTGGIGKLLKIKVPSSGMMVGNISRTIHPRFYSLLRPASCMVRNICPRCLRPYPASSCNQYSTQADQVKTTFINIRQELYRYINRTDPRVILVFFYPGQTGFKVSNMVSARNCFTALVLDKWRKTGDQPTDDEIPEKFQHRVLNKVVHDLYDMYSWLDEAAPMFAQYRQTDTIKAEDVKIFGSLLGKVDWTWLIYRLAADTFRREHIYQRGLLEAFFILPESQLREIGIFENGAYDHVYSNYLYGKKGMLQSALYKVFFQITYLRRVTISHLTKLNRTELNGHLGANVKKAGVIRLVPAPDLDDWGPRDQLHNLLLLLWVLRTHKQKSLLETIEQLSSGTKETLMSEGFEAHHIVKYLTRLDIFTIHKVLVQRPSYFTTHVPQYGVTAIIKNLQDDQYGEEDGEDGILQETAGNKQDEIQQMEGTES